MTENQEKGRILIRYPQIRGYILKAYELQRMLAARFEASVYLEELEEQSENRVVLMLDEREIYTETAERQAQINYQHCFEAVRRLNIAERENIQPRPEEGPEPDDDPDHRRWLNSVCSGD